MVFGHPIRQKYNRVTKSDLREIDRCLGLTRGNRRAAAAILGLEDEQLRNLINTHGCLKSKWGQKATNRPREIDFVKGVILELKPDARRELIEWLSGLDREVQPADSNSMN